MFPIAWRCVLSALLAVVGLASARPARAADPAAEARQAWQLLDYIAVDYPAAIQNGEVVDAGEYAEMQEFTASVSAKLAALVGPEEPLIASSHAACGVEGSC